jgi:hypothetical protein
MKQSAGSLIEAKIQSNLEFIWKLVLVFWDFLKHK